MQFPTFDSFYPMKNDIFSMFNLLTVGTISMVSAQGIQCGTSWSLVIFIYLIHVASRLVMALWVVIHAGGDLEEWVITVGQKSHIEDGFSGQLAFLPLL